MLPEFPQFKKLELSDRQDVEQITQRYVPYSDFNFVSLHSWNVTGEMAVAKLHGNLVVRFTDYLTGDFFYSFLGDQRVNETCRALLDLSRQQGLEPKLKLVPQVSAEKLDPMLFRIQEDPDNFDYIYHNEKLATMSGKQFQNKRNLFNRFKASYQDAQVVITQTLTEKMKQDILDLDKKWAVLKNTKLVDFNIANEMQAVKNFIASFDTTQIDKFIFLGLYVKEALVGFSITSIINDQYAICHFSKGDTQYHGVYEYMLHRYAEHLHPEVQFVNYEQDLGLANLRFSKKSFRPVTLFKKYVIMNV